MNYTPKEWKAYRGILLSNLLGFIQKLEEPEKMKPALNLWWYRHERKRRL